MGYDTPKKLGDRETGGGLSLPIWINFMDYALKSVAVTEYQTPEGVVSINGEWYYDEYARGAGIRSVGMQQDPGAGSAAPSADANSAGGAIQILPPSDEKKRILDLFKN